MMFGLFWGWLGLELGFLVPFASSLGLYLESGSLLKGLFLTLFWVN
jgi:hypothetical protein